MIIIALSI